MPTIHASSMAGIVTLRSHSLTLSIACRAQLSSGSDEVMSIDMTSEETRRPPIQPMTAAT